MRLATITNWAYGVTVFLALTSAATMLMASKAQDDERSSVDQRYRLDKAASKAGSEVMILSDKAREYVITGDPAQLSVYNRELSQLQTVEQRVRRMKDQGAGPDELEALADAARLADGLRDEQKAAITLRQRDDADGARRIVFGVEYERELDRAANDVERFEYRLDQRTDAEVRSAGNCRQGLEGFLGDRTRHYRSSFPRRTLLRL